MWPRSVPRPDAREPRARSRPPRARGRRVVAPTIFVLATSVLAACDCRPRPGVALRQPLPTEPLPTPLGGHPIRNPLNLYDLLLEGSPTHEVIGTIDDVPVTTSDLESQSVGAFARIAERAYEARDRGWRWRVERTALERAARAAELDLRAFLLREYAALPAPTDVEVDAIARDEVRRELAPAERTRAARSLWRFRRWRIVRSLLVREGLEGMELRRLTQPISPREHADPARVEAVIDGQPVTRADMTVLAGFEEALARDEYYRVARLQFEDYVTAFLREREARHVGVSVDQLVRRAGATAPGPITEADVRDFLAREPAYAADPQGFERARDVIRRLRAIAAQEALDTRLRATADVRFLLAPPVMPKVPVEVPFARTLGRADAPGVLMALHGVGCDNCTRGSRLLVAILREYGDRLRVFAGDYFTPDRLESYRGALALACADDEQAGASWRLLEVLVDDFGKGEVGELVERGAGAGLDARRLERCLDDDRFMPLLIENAELAERLGLERNVPGLFVNGVRLGELADGARLRAQIDEALATPAPALPTTAGKALGTFPPGGAAPKTTPPAAAKVQPTGH